MSFIQKSFKRSCGRLFGSGNMWWIKKICWVGLKCIILIAIFREFRLLSLELLDHCYKQDDAQALQLLTYELAYWGHETCLSLAVIVNNKQFLAHPWFVFFIKFNVLHIFSCQILLADLWHGGLRIRRYFFAY